MRPRAGRGLAAASSEHRKARQTLRLGGPSRWWARQDSNLRLPPCEGGTLPLSYAPVAGRLMGPARGVKGRGAAAGLGGGHDPE